ncbi:MAG: hypothetical protein MJ106_07975, partial [Lentisphaeria bacterium]|nr:hypothetical protein [Lentisphaeria bacterium]
MKIGRLLLTMLFGLILNCIFAQEQFTLVGNSPLDVRSMGLLQNNFGAEEKLEGTRLIRACESIDNSMIVILADQLPAATLEEWFSKPGICNSMREFLRRGGVLYFGWNSWTTLNQSLASTRDFYKSCALPFPSISELADFPHEFIKDLPKDAIANKECDASFLRSPHDYTTSNAKNEFQMTSIRWFKNWNIPGLETYFATAEGEPVVVGIRNVLGKGTVIFSDCFTPMRQKEPFFIENLIEYAYGKREKVSAKDIAAKEIAKLTGSAGSAKKVEVQPILKLAADENSAETLNFTLLETRKVPQLTSEAKVFGNADLITVAFKCMRPEADKVINTCSKRDDTVWYDDAVCIMFAADEAEAPNHSFILNSDGAVYDARGGNALWNADFTLKTERHSDCWEGVFSIAPSEFGVDLAKDHYILFNIGREGTPTTEVTAAFPGYNIPTGYAILGIEPAEALAAEYIARRQPPVVNTPYVIWNDNPYRKKYTTSLPAKPEDSADITITVARNEQECAALFITNFTDRNMVFRLEPDFMLQGTEIPFTDLLAIKEVLPRLNQVGDPQFDGISGLNEAGIVSVPSCETKMLWLDIKTMLPAGTYKWNLETVPTLARDVRKKFHVTVEVLDYEFPKRLKADVLGFG